MEIKSKIYRIQINGGNLKTGTQQQAYCAIPMKWFKMHDLEKGDKLEVLYSTDLDQKSFTVKIVDPISD